MRIIGLALAFAILVIAPNAASAQASSGAKSPVIGVWKVVETQTGPVTQPSLFIFTARHFSRMIVAGSQARTPFKDQANPTAAEKIAAYDSITANTGTYQIAGDSIVFDVLLAKSPSFLGRANAKTTFKLEGQTLTLTNVENKSFLKLARVE